MELRQGDIVNPNCIKGYFSPRGVNEDYRIP